MKNAGKRLMALLLLPVLLLAGCGKKEEIKLPVNEKGQLDYGYANYTPPQAGEEVAVMTTSMGTIKIRLFPDVAPKAVENFKSLAKEGYYNGVIFHRVINNFMIQSGDPTGTGYGGSSIWGEDFEDEFSPTAHNFRYSISMANAGQNTNGSQFFINQCNSVPEQLLGQMESLPEYFPEETLEIYKNYGGYPSLDYRHTVFGYVYEGMEVVDAIAGVKTDKNDRPIKEVVIEKLEIIVI